MKRTLRCSLACCLLLAAVASGASPADDSRPGRDPAQPIDEEYTKKIREYTTETFFLSPLVDYLPAAPGVPTPKSVLGDVAGAPGKLPYSAEVYRYFRDARGGLAARARAHDRDDGRGARDDRGDGRLGGAPREARREPRAPREARRPAPRSRLDDAEAEKLIAPSVPVYYITGTIHSPETGAPDGADGARLPARRRREPLRPLHPRQRRHDDHARRRGGRPRPAGGRLQLAPRAPRRELAAARLLGPLRRARQQPRRDGHDARARRATS